MHRSSAFFSPAGILSTLILLAGLGIVFLWRGNLLFSPGELTAKTAPGVTLNGFDSHAAFEAECGRCHAPFQARQGELCVDCHQDVAVQIRAQSGTHGGLVDALACMNCHPDHRGRGFDPTAAALEQFDHNLTRFSLVWHRFDYAGAPLECTSCHTTQGEFAVDLGACEACHAGHDGAFMLNHVESFGRDCLACHDGKDTMANFSHARTGFPLLGAHQETACESCHAGGQFSDTPAQCVVCHAEPEVHAGMFSLDCESCHTPEQPWIVALLDGKQFEHSRSTGFSLVKHTRNYDETPFKCVDCHGVTPDGKLTFVLDTCIACHTQADSGFMNEHRVRFGDGCLECHDGSGEMANFDHNRVFVLDGRHAELACEECHVNQVFSGTPTQCVQCHEEPQIHLGLFGVQCEKCHSTQAWSPASLQSHTFPLNHGESGLVSCETCHPTTYVQYTCYGCHEHQEAKIIRKHAEEGIRQPELANCVECHPTGREKEGRGGDD